MKIDLHVHSKEISNCGRLSIEEIIDLYTKAEYDAIVLTNHFNSETAAILRERGIKDFHKAFFDCLDQAAAIGKEKGLLILPGHELRFDCHPKNDYLVFGMTPGHCREWQKICAMTEKEFSEFAAAEGILFYQAHPFRNGMKIVPPEYLFGIEIKNTHPRHDSRNEIAAAWAEKYQLHKIAGSDCHQTQDVATSAILTDHTVATIQDLVHILKNDLYTIL